MKDFSKIKRALWAGIKNYGKKVKEKPRVTEFRKKRGRGKVGLQTC